MPLEARATLFGGGLLLNSTYRISDMARILIFRGTVEHRSSNEYEVEYDEDDTTYERPRV